MPPAWWMRRYIRMTRDPQFLNGKLLAEWSKHQRRQGGPDAAVVQGLPGPRVSEKEITTHAEV